MRCHLGSLDVRDMVRAAALAAGMDVVDAELLGCNSEPLAGSSGAATGSVVRLSGRVLAGRRELPFTMIRKTFQPLIDGRHAVAAREQTHWAYYRREQLAYMAGVVPQGPHLAAPRCLAVTEDAVYLADVTGPAESVAVAAQRLAAWQAHTPIPDVAWLGGSQLAQRIAVSTLDWSAVDAPDMLRRIWDRRDALLATLDAVPSVVCHGDFHVRHLIACGDVTTVLDWATLGAGPLGSDLAHLALSAGVDPLEAYLVGLGGRFDPRLAKRGYHVTVALTATSRVHWMLSRGILVPPEYLDLATLADGLL